MIRENYVSFLPRTAESPDLKPDSLLHTTQMHGQMRCIGDQVPLRIKQRTREIKSFLDVRAGGCLLQGETHLLCNRHEPVTED